MARFKVEYGYGIKPAGGSIVSRFGTHDNVAYQWKDNNVVDFADADSAMAFFKKIIDSWEEEEIYLKDRNPEKIHYTGVVVKELKDGKWVVVKSMNYQDWYKANKERKQKEYAEKQAMEKNSQEQPAGIESDLMENKKNMKKQIKLKENELRSIVESKVRDMLNESDFGNTLKGMFAQPSQESMSMFDQMNQQLEQLGEGIYVSKPFSEPERVMVMIRCQNPPVNEIVEIMKQFGYTYNNEIGIDWMQFRKEPAAQEGGDMQEAMEPGSISHGTMNAEDLIPKFMSKLFKSNPEKAREIWQQYPNLLQALCDKQAGVPTDWFQSEEASEILNNDLFDAMDAESPEGHYFGSHPGDGSDYGYWPSDEEQINENKKHINESQFRKIVENKVRGMLKEMFENNRK